MGACRQVLKYMLLVPFCGFLALAVCIKILVQMCRYGPRTVCGQKNREEPPACLQDEDLGTHGYLTLKDVRIHYVSTGSQDKPLMLLVHGFPEFWFSWRNQLKEFHTDYRVVAIDQRGYGDSDKPDAIASYDISILVEDLKQIIAALGYKQCVLVGHDWGGKVAWRLAQTHPDLVSRFIVLNCPSGLAYQLHARAGGSQLRKSWYFFFFQIPRLPEFFMRSRDYSIFDDRFLKEPMGVKSGKVTPEDLEAYKFTFGRHGFKGPVNYYRQMVRSPDFMQTREVDMIRVKAPTLIVWGDQDAALDTQLAFLSSENSVEGGATVKIIEGASHWVQVDRPDLVNAHMRDFLTATDKAATDKDTQ